MSGFVITSEGSISLPHVRLHHLRTRPDRESDGRILLLGGSNFDLQLKRAFLSSSFVERFEVATYEPRGIGRSDVPPGAWSMADYATDALGVLDALGWETAHLVGESFGGMTALHLALRKPERISRLVVVSATAGGPGGASYDISGFLGLPREEAAERALILQDSRAGTLRTEDPARFEAKLAARIQFETAFAARSVASGGYERLLAARRTHNIWEALPEVTVPTLVIAGMHDGQAAPEAQQKLAQALGNAVYWLRPGGHGLLFDEPDLTAEICDQWLCPKTLEAQEEAE